MSEFSSFVYIKTENSDNANLGPASITSLKLYLEFKSNRVSHCNCH